jgi:hypothetical protein
VKVIDVSTRGATGRVTCLSYGAMRSGKTRFAATFPRPLFLSDATETGWTTIANMNRDSFWEPGHTPKVWSIENAADMMKALADADQIIKTRPGEIQTIVVDSLTFYADLFFSTLDAAARSTGRTPDNRRLYQDLGSHLKELRIRVHMLPVNVVWLALEKSADPENPIGGPMLPGQNAAKFAAGCDYIFYHRSYQIRPIDPVQWEVRTRRFGQYPAGGRDEGRLPDPLGYYGEVADKPEPIFVTDCTYRTLAEALGIHTPQEVIPPSIVVPSSDNGTKKAQSGRPSASR